MLVIADTFSLLSLTDWSISFNEVNLIIMNKICHFFIPSDITWSCKILILSSSVVKETSWQETHQEIFLVSGTRNAEIWLNQHAKKLQIVSTARFDCVVNNLLGEDHSSLFILLYPLVITARDENVLRTLTKWLF